jgi:predicted flavoprotein YhiN
MPRVTVPYRTTQERSSRAGTDIAVVGAGAAGLTAAIRAAENGARTLLWNAHPRVGLKILMSGGTRCNVTHREVTERDFRGSSPAAVARVLRAFPAEAAREWIESLGVPLKLEPTGKYFPQSDDAHTVLAALLGRAEELGVEMRSGARVIRLERGTDTWRLGIQHIRDSNPFSAQVARYREGAWPLPHAEPDEWAEASRVILSTGGLSFPRTGSDGTGYGLALALRHTLVPPVPALTPLSSEDSLSRMAQGVTTDAELTLRVEGRVSERVRGSLLITHFGFSGPAALDLSRFWLRAEGSQREVTASFAPREDIESVWLAEGRSTPRRILSRWMPERLAEVLCEEVGVDPSALASQVPRAKRMALLRNATERPLAMTGTLGYEKAECTAGGVPLSEVNPSTMESRKAPGLYLCGEILDVDGRLGGFNFQWAWSSGTVAARSAASGPQGDNFMTAPSSRPG